MTAINLLTKNTFQISSRTGFKILNIHGPWYVMMVISCAHNYIIAKHRRALFCPYFWATSLRTLYLILLSKHLSFLFSRNLIKEATLLAATVVFCTWDNALGESGNTYPYCRKFVDTFSSFAVGTAMFTKPGGTSYPPSTKRTAWTCSRENI